MTEQVSNVMWNITEPFTGKAEGQLQGTVQHIVTEVLVSKALRFILKWENRGFIELATIHAVSQPFLGGLFFGDNIRTLSSSPSNMEAATDGAKQTPAVLIAAYILASAQKGLHLPRFTIRDLGVTLISKVVSRVVANNIYSSLSEPMQQATIAHDTMVAVQKRNSRIVGN